MKTSIPDESNQDSSCIGLACVGGMLSAGVGAVMMAGWRIAGNPSDWFPSLLIVAMALVCVSVVGRVAGPARIVCVIASTLIAILLGHAIIRVRGYDGFVGSPVTSLVAYAVALVVAAGSEYVLLRLRRWTFVDRSDERRWGLLPTSSFRLLAPTLVIWIIVVATAYQYAAVVNRTGFRIITVPFDVPSSSMPLAGFSVWQGDQPVMMESIPAIEQVQWISGQIRSDDNFRFLRAGYAFAASLFLGMMPPETALRCVNLIAWICTLGVIGGLSLAWPQKKQVDHRNGSVHAAFASMALAAVGVGFGIHFNDTTPHLMAFCLYAIGAAMIVGFGFAESPQPWSRHLLFAVAVGFFSWTYNVAQMLVFVYVLVSIRRQRWLSIAMTSAIVMLHRPILRWSLPALGINVREVEGEYFARALAAWRSSFNQGVGEVIKDFITYAWQSISAMETPWVLLIAGMGAWFVIPRSQRLLWASVWAAPILSSIVFAPTSPSRGYIVFGGSIVLYLVIGQSLGRWLARDGARRLVAVAGLFAIVAGNFVWTTAHHHGWYGPAKVFLMGWPDASAVLASPPSIVLDAAGGTTVPNSLGGDGQDTIAPSDPRIVLDEPINAKSFAIALLSRLPFVVSIVLLVSLISRSIVWRRGLVAGSLLLFVLSTTLGFASVTRQSRYFDPAGAVGLSPGETLTYEIQIDPTSGDRFASAAADAGNTEIYLWLGPTGSIDVKWEADDHVVRWGSKPTSESDADSRSRPGEPLHATSTDDVSRILGAATWKFTFANVGDQAAYLHGWQSPTYRGRRSSGDGPVLPAIEVRLRDPKTGALSAVMY